MCQPVPDEYTADIWRYSKYIKNNSLSHKKQRSTRCLPFLQLVLSKYLCVKPENIDISKCNFGKPFISSEFNIDIDFSISYSGDHVFVAVGSGSIGADAEEENPNIRIAQTARYWLHPCEASRIIKLPSAQQIYGFYQAWTLRESYLKMIGTGFRLRRDVFEITQSQTSLEKNGANAYLGHAVVEGGRHLAVAAKTPIKKFCLFHLGSSNSEFSIENIEMNRDFSTVIPTAWRVQ